MPQVLRPQRPSTTGLDKLGQIINIAGTVYGIRVNADSLNRAREEAKSDELRRQELERQSGDMRKPFLDTVEGKAFLDRESEKRKNWSENEYKKLADIEHNKEKLKQFKLTFNEFLKEPTAAKAAALKAFKDKYRVDIARIGEVGNLTEQEQKAGAALIPGLQEILIDFIGNHTDLVKGQFVEEKFNQLEDYLEAGERGFYKSLEVLGKRLSPSQKEYLKELKEKYEIRSRVFE